MHAGRQDVAILRRTWETDITSVFDTQVAAGFLGFGNQEGYEQLVRRVLGVRLRGGEGFTRWDKRPLTDKQIAYAADDARCLLALGSALERQLAERGRVAWAREESRIVEQSEDVRTAEKAYERLPKLGRLDHNGRAVAMRLAVWRDEIARELDRPPAAVLPDQVLVELAKRTPKDKAGLDNIRGLPQQTQHRRGAELVEQIALGRQEEPPAATALAAQARLVRGPAGVAGPGRGAPAFPRDRGGHRADRDPVRADRAGGRCAARARGERCPGSGGLAPRAGGPGAVRPDRGPAPGVGHARRRAGRSSRASACASSWGTCRSAPRRPRRSMPGHRRRQARSPAPCACAWS